MTGCSKLPGNFPVGCKFFGPFSPITRDAQQATSILSSPDSSAPADAAQSKRRDTPREVCRRYRTRRSRVNGSPPPPVVLGASHRASPRVARRNREFEAGFPWWEVPLGRFFAPPRQPGASGTNARTPRRAEMSAQHATASTPRAAAAARAGPRGAPARRGSLGAGVSASPAPKPHAHHVAKTRARRSGSRPRAPPARPARLATTRPRRARARVARRVDEGQPRRRQGQEGIQG